MPLTSLENNFCVCVCEVGLKVSCFGAEHCEHAQLQRSTGKRSSECIVRRRYALLGCSLINHT